MLLLCNLISFDIVRSAGDPPPCSLWWLAFPGWGITPNASSLSTQFQQIKRIYVSSRELTCPLPRHFWKWVSLMFLFPRWDMFFMPQFHSGKYHTTTKNWTVWGCSSWQGRRGVDERWWKCAWRCQRFDDWSLMPSATSSNQQVP